MIVVDPTNGNARQSGECCLAGIEQILYISCNPLAMAMDLEKFSEAGVSPGDEGV